MRLILDTNVWVSGLLLPQSSAGRILKEWEKARFRILMCPYILEEIGRVLAYPKTKKRLQWDEAKIQHYLELLAFFSEIISSGEISHKVQRDPKDSPILSAFVQSGADFLISGDKDLLDLREQYAILSVSEFLEKLEM